MKTRINPFVLMFITAMALFLLMPTLGINPFDLTFEDEHHKIGLDLKEFGTTTYSWSDKSSDSSESVVIKRWSGEKTTYEFYSGAPVSVNNTMVTAENECDVAKILFVTRLRFQRYGIQQKRLKKCFFSTQEPTG